MNFEDLQKRRVRRALIIGHVMVALSLLTGWLLYLFSGSPFLETMMMTGFTSAISGVIASYAGALWLKHLTKQGMASISEEDLERSSKPLLESSRVMAMRETHWRYGIHFFTVKGKRMAYAEEVNPKNMIFIALLRIVNLRIWMRMTFSFHLSETEQYTIEKKFGLAPFYLKDDRGNVLAKFTYRWYELLFLKIHLKSPDGTYVALLNGGFYGDVISLQSVEGEEWMRIRVGGVPKNHWPYSLTGDTSLTLLKG